MTENNTEAVQTAPATSETPAKTPKAKTRCECSLFDVQTNLRESESGGDLIWDEEFTTGCTGTETNNLFAPGHDAKLKSFLIRMGVLGHRVTRDNGVRVDTDAIGWAAKYGFSTQVIAGIRRAEEKVAARTLREQSAAAKKADRESAKAAAKLAKVEAKLAADEAKAAELEYKVRVAESQDAVMSQASAAAETVEKTEVESDEDKALYADQEESDLITAKVGRWEYTGRVTDSPEFGLRFTYEDREGNLQTTSDYKIVEPAAV